MRLEVIIIMSKCTELPKGFCKPQNKSLYSKDNENPRVSTTFAIIKKPTDFISYFSWDESERVLLFYIIAPLLLNILATDNYYHNIQLAMSAVKQ